MQSNYLETTLGATEQNVYRLGLSASYWPGKKTIYKAIDQGVNYFFDNDLVLSPSNGGPAVIQCSVDHLVGCGINIGRTRPCPSIRPTIP